MRCTQLHSRIAAANSDESMDDHDVESRMELDSHADMPVVGRNAYILAESMPMGA